MKLAVKVRYHFSCHFKEEMLVKLLFASISAVLAWSGTYSSLYSFASNVNHQINSATAHKAQFKSFYKFFCFMENIV